MSGISHLFSSWVMSEFWPMLNEIGVRWEFSGVLQKQTPNSHKNNGFLNWPFWMEIGHNINITAVISELYLLFIRLGFGESKIASFHWDLQAFFSVAYIYCWVFGQQKLFFSPLRQSSNQEEITTPKLLKKNMDSHYKH